MPRLTQSTELYERAFAEFPEELVPEGEWKVLYAYADPDFGVGGVDEKGRLVSFNDDGTVLAYHLEDATVDKSYRGSWGLDAEYDILGGQQLGSEFMLGRDTGEWLWVHPKYEWMTDP